MVTEILMVASSALAKLRFAFVLLSACMLFASIPVHAAETMLEFETDAQAAQYAQLTKDHRCLKCQNQNLASSGAGIAQDLKREIYQRVIDGESSEDISDYLVTRYGDFVLYKPPFKASTIALWLGPFVLLFGALWYGVRISKRSGKVEIQTDDAALSKARNLLND